MEDGLSGSPGVTGWARRPNVEPGVPPLWGGATFNGEGLDYTEPPKRSMFRFSSRLQ